MMLYINGESRELDGATDVASVLHALGLPARACIVEHNGEALRRDAWPSRTVAQGDRLEIVRITAGG